MDQSRSTDALSGTGSSGASSSAYADASTAASARELWRARTCANFGITSTVVDAWVRPVATASIRVRHGSRNGWSAPVA